MSDADSSVNRLGTSSSGLTLVLPSLKALKGLNAKKKSSPLLGESTTPVKKNARPVKLKPLKEVLSSLITKIKKKDDYAFFLGPVDLEKVPGYLDVITQPMDFGTMTEKIAKSKYRSLDEFAEDFRLVISNAKSFNPPGTIYHTEAERIEAWASDHISKAASCVIEYEADWNIDADRDEDVNVDADEDAGPGRTGSIGPDTPGARRSPSVLSASVPPINRRGGRNAAAKKEGIVSDSLESDGHLPGFKDGVGVFPPGSDWAEVMLALKLKGKRYRSKKERLRMEKGGPPYAADGSLDYAEMEDPFSVLSALVPDPPCTIPLVTPLFPPPPSQQNPSQQITLPLPINVPTPTKIPIPVTATPAAPVSQPTPTESNSKSKYRHWTITRPTPQRGKAKEPTVEERPPTPEWRKPRPLHTADYGLFPSLATTDSSSPGGKPEVLATQEQLFGALYTSLENPAVAVSSDSETSSSSTINRRVTATATATAAVAQGWLREVVYGGWDGLAYTRSIAEFVAPCANTSANLSPDEAKVEDDVSDRGSLDPNATLAEYVDTVLVNELTEGRHRTMEAAIVVPVPAPDEQQNLHPTPVVPLTQLDLGSLISAPNELFDAENAWVGAGANEDSAVLARALDHATHLLEQLQQQHAQRAALTGEARAEGMDVDAESKSDPEGEKKKEGERRGDLETELRMNLIALAKRAPLDQIARMPSELVPPHLRHVVPTIGY